MNCAEVVGANIKKFRKMKKLTQQALSKKANISRSYLADLEGGRYNPSLTTLEYLASALGITVLDLIAGDSTAENSYFNTLNNTTSPEVSTESKQAFSDEIDKHTIVKPITNLGMLKKEIKKVMTNQKVTPEDKETLFKYVSDLYWKYHK
jgi:transcriptional regulator with XRE-family HTH domain